MQVLILAPQWGYEEIAFENFLIKIKGEGFDGVDTWIPQEVSERKNFIKLLEAYEMPIVCHQHQATGSDIKSFCKSFEYQLNLAMECSPILINSHSGRDFFSLDDQLRVIDTARDFADRNNIRVAHETHRGRIGFSPYNFNDLLNHRPQMCVTADLSHWVCVTESYLEHSQDILHKAMAQAEHIHARVGHTQGPQVPDPRVPQWQQTTGLFLNWWLQILSKKASEGRQVFTITPEFGPPPYMTIDLATNSPLADQTELNIFIKDLIKSNLPVS
jgi:sugar phosphate isomerase/epimerase